MIAKYLECGKVTGTHGVRGAVRMVSLCDSPEVLCALKRMYRKDGDGYTALNVKSAFVQKAMAVVTFDEVDTLDAAILLRDVTLYADRDDIPRNEGDFFISDLIGLAITDEESGEVYGRLKQVISPAGRDIYVVAKSGGGEFMIPCVAEFIRRIAPDEGAIYVHLIGGMID